MVLLNFLELGCAGRDSGQVSGDPTVIAQSVNVQIVAYAYQPIVIAQSVNVSIVPAEGGGFTPTSLTGLTAWYDMLDSTAYVNNGGVLDSVKNKVSGVNCTATTTARPAFSATGLQGHACASHDGTNDILLGTEAAVLALFTDTPPRTLIYIAKHNATAAVHAVVGFGRSDSALASTGFFGQRQTANHWTSGLSDASSVARNVDSVAAPDTNVHVFVFRHTGTQEAIRLDNSAYDPGPTNQDGTVTPTRFGIGGRPNSGAMSVFLNGVWGEILMYNRALTDTEVNQCVTYLQNRWA